MTSTLPDGRPILWQPHAGPQTAFLASSAYEVLYGGAAGGGKSQALLFGALRQVHHPQYRALILRRTFPELRELMEAALPIFTAIGASWNVADKRFRFPSGALVDFGYCVSGDTPIRLPNGNYKPICALSVGEYVDTLEGPRKVLRKWHVGAKPSVRISVSGKHVIASLDHPLMMADGSWQTPRALFRQECACSGCKSLEVCNRATPQPLSLIARVAQFVPARPNTNSEVFGLVAGDTGRETLTFQPTGSTDCCSSGTRLCGELVHHLEGVAQGRTPSRVGAGTFSHPWENGDGRQRTLAHSQILGEWYFHPYTMEARPMFAGVRSCDAEMVPVGEQDLWDIEVGSANHYVSYPNIIHRNCESYREVLQYQGQAFQYIGFDELGQIADEKVWTYLISRNRPTAEGQTLQLRASANPGGPGHQWLKRRFVDRCPTDGTPVTVDGFTRAFVAAKLKDNPTLMANDPTYGERLALLPELERKWLADGDWSAGAGLALDVRREHHLVPPFRIPDHWTLFSALDWGYNHPFSWGLYAVNEDGVVYCLDTATGRHLQPPEIADRFKAIANGRPIQYTVAGHDVWADVRARGENIPTLFEQFAKMGFPMVKANISRVAGVQNLRRYLRYPNPRFVLFDTPNNRAVFECLESRVSDPRHPEDVLKVDADDQGNGGDDHYDQVRYALASRPLAPHQPVTDKLKDDDRARPYDWKAQKFSDLTPDKLARRLMQQDERAERPTYRVPRNPR